MTRVLPIIILLILLAGCFPQPRPVETPWPAPDAWNQPRTSRRTLTPTLAPEQAKARCSRGEAPLQCDRSRSRRAGPPALKQADLPDGKQTAPFSIGGREDPLAPHLTTDARLEPCEWIPVREGCLGDPPPAPAPVQTEARQGPPAPATPTGPSPTVEPYPPPAPTWYYDPYPAP